MSKISILIVEDEAIVAEDLAGVLRQLGYDVAGITATGEEAIELGRRHQPALVLMDIRLAGPMDGIAAAQQIHCECKIPVLFLTAHSDPGMIESAQQTGAFGYILKPFDERDLRIQIEMALYKHAAEQQLRESDKRLALAISAAQIGMFDWNLTTGSILWTQTHEAIFGYAPASPTVTTMSTTTTKHDYRKWADRVHPEDLPLVEEASHRCMQENKPLEVQYRIIWPDGSVHWIETKAVFLCDNGQAANRMLGAVVDITERIKAKEEEAKLEEVNRHLQKSASLSRMAGAIAHHFNNKLHAVMGYLELAKENLARNDTSSTNLTAAMLAADQATEVSKMMLTYLGQVTGKREPLDLSETCRKLLVTLQAGMPKKVVLETDMPSPGPTIKADAKHIQQVLSSLVTNAWESAGACMETTIHLTIGSVPAADIPVARRFPINWQQKDSIYACLEVQDNGCGITNEDLEEVFSPFFSTKFTGRGLGLSMVLGLVQAYGGVVTVLSSLGKGSVFRVFLPLSAEPVPRQPDEADRTMEFQAGAVLVVDDDATAIDIADKMLAKLGFTVLCAGDGIEALELFQKHRQEIRLVLCDVSMPRMDGWETLSALRQIAPAIPVILASGYNEDQVMDGTHSEQPHAFLGKPYDFATLKKTIGCLGSLQSFHILAESPTVVSSITEEN